METTEAYQEYFKKTRTKVSLATWAVLILNNPFSTTTSYLGVLLFDLSITMIGVITLYHKAGSLPSYSQALLNTIEYHDPTAVAYVVIGITILTWFTLATMGILIVKDFQWKVYSEKRFSFKILAGSTIIFRGPLYGIILLYTLHSFLSFNDVDNVYLKYISIICSLLNCGMLAIYTYVGSILYNLAIPNDLLPWSDTSNLLCLFRAIFKFFLVITLKFNDSNPILLYLIGGLATLACGYRLYLIMFKAQIMNETVLNVTVIIEFAVLHLMLGFLLTSLYQGEETFILFVVSFLPVTCIAGLYLKFKARRSWLSRLMNDSMRDENDLLHSYLYLIQLCMSNMNQGGETDAKMDKDMIILEKIHSTQCQSYFQKVKKKMEYAKQQRDQAYILPTENISQSGFGIQTVATADIDNLQDDYLKRLSGNNVNHKLQHELTMSTQNRALNKINALQKFNSDPLDISLVDQSGGGAIQIYNSHLGLKQLPNNISDLDLDNNSPIKINARSKPTFNMNQFSISAIDEGGNNDDQFQDISSPTNGILQSNSAGPQPLGGENRLNIPSITRPSRRQTYNNLKQQTFEPLNKQDTRQSSKSQQSEMIVFKGFKRNVKIQKKESTAGISSIFIKDENIDVTVRESKAQSSKNQALKEENHQKENKKDFFRKFAMHFFNYHLSEHPHLGFIIRLLKVYFSFNILGNPYLAHFLLHQLATDTDLQSEDILTSNQRLINQRYIDSLICQRETQDEEISSAQKSMMGQLDLRTMLHVNQMMLEFDNSLERATDQIHDFWNNLLHNRDMRNIFTQGYKISEQLQHVRELVEEITLKQNSRETKVYLQMANFYQDVLFKPSESLEMFEKARVAFSSKRSNKLRDDREDSNVGAFMSNNTEKCLVMTDICLNKPMKIVFANKAACNSLQYTQDDIMKLTINQLMPIGISETHQSFVDEFMSTGKSVFLQTYRQDFIRQRTGTVVPIKSFVCINSISRKHMILIFEEIQNFHPFADHNDNSPETFIMGSKELDLCEIATNFFQVTGITPASFKNFKEQYERTLSLDDLVKLTNYDCEPSQLLDQFDAFEAEISFKNVTFEHLQQFNNQNSNAISLNGNQQQSFQQFNNLKIENSDNITNAHQSSHFPMIEGELGVPVLRETENFESSANFKMRILDLKFLGGRYEMRIFAFKKRQGNYSFHDSAAVQPFVQNANSRASCYSAKDLLSGTHKNHHTSTILGEETSKQLLGMDDNQSNSEANEESNILDGILNLQSNQNNMSATTQQILSTYHSQVSNDATPKTLTIIYRLVIFIVVTMITASIIVLSMAYTNIDSSYNSVAQSNNSFEAIEELSSIRLLFRALTNINLGYLDNKSKYIDDRTLIYENIISFLNDGFRADSSSLEILINQFEELFSNLEVNFISSKSIEYIQLQTLPKGMNLFTTKVFGLLTSPDHEKYIEQTQSPLFNLNAHLNNQNQANFELSLIERDLFFVLNNSNGMLYNNLQRFGPIFIDQQVNSINKYLQVLSGISLAVCSLILLSALAVIPLFGKIQNRVLELMKLFFQIDNSIKISTIKKIQSFQKNIIHTEERERSKFANKFNNTHNNMDEGSLEDTKMPLKFSIHKKQGKQHKKEMNYSIFSQQKQNVQILKRKKFDDPADMSSKRFKVDKQGNKLSKFAKNTFGMKKNEPQEVFNNAEKKKAYKEKKEIDIDEIMNQELEDSSEGPDYEEERKSDSVSNGEFDSIDNPKKKIKKAKKQNNQIQEDLEQEIKEEQKLKEKEYLADFIKYIKKRKIAQSIFILLMLILMSSYFIIIYMVSNEMFDKINQSMSDMQLIYGRMTCSLNVLNTFSESYFKDPMIVIQGRAPFNEQIEACLNIEKRYLKEIIGNTKPYLSTVTAEIESLETGDLCPNLTTIAAIPTNICLQMTEQIIKQGLSTYYFNIIRTTQQMYLELQSIVKDNRLEVNMMRQAINDKIGYYTDVLTMIVRPVQRRIETSTQANIMEYYMGQKKILTLVFSCYLAVTLIFAFFFFASIYLKIRTEMLQSNRLLYIIDYELLKEEQRQVIHNFLLNF